MKPRLHASALAALAVFLIAGPAASQGGPTAVIPGALVPFYIEFTLDQGPDKSETFVALGACHVITNDVPMPGVVLAGCALRVTQGPDGFLGGVATSMSIFNPLRLPGAGTGSFWTPPKKPSG